MTVCRDRCGWSRCCLGTRFISGEYTMVRVCLNVAGHAVGAAADRMICDAEAVELRSRSRPGDDGFVLARVLLRVKGAIVIEDCTPPPPPSGWVCEAGEAVFLADTTGFEGTVYDSQAEALEDPDCQDVMAATTFTIGGTCALVGDEASFTISGSLGEGLTLTVAGQTITTSPFSVDVTAAGSYPYTVTLDEGFELAVGSPAASGTILIQDCTSDDEVDDVDELPFTGIDPGALALASMALLGTGTMMLRSSRKLEES